MAPHDFFSWGSAQLAVVGALGGALKGISGTCVTWRERFGKLGQSVLGGAIATSLFGPTMAVGIKWISGDVFTPENIWLLSGAITAIVGVGAVTFVMTFVGILAKKAGLEASP